jgi:hypothetical protein
MQPSATASLSDDQRSTLRRLVQLVARAFFDVEQVVALDQLSKHDVSGEKVYLLKDGNTDTID